MAALFPRGNGFPGRPGAPEEGRPRSVVLGAVCCLALTLALLGGIIRIMAGSEALFARELARFAPPERTGLPEAAYPAMAARLADYLAGRTESFQFYLTAPDGAALPCFHDYELAHMADCRRLIRLAGLVSLTCAALAVLCAAPLFRRGRPAWRAARRGMLAALRGLSAAAAVLVLWAVLNFDGLFVTFHHLAFANDLWLLNPRTDLLIRLMPEEMFVDLGLKGLCAFAAGMVLLFGPLLLRGRSGT